MVRFFIKSHCTVRYTIFRSYPSGSVSVGEGLSKTFTITSSSGYVISDLIIDGKSVGAKKSYTFDNVYTNHSIKAEFKKAENVNPSTGV